jgi:ankyrin repeat protein
MRMLLHYGCVVDIRDRHDNITPIHVACARGFAICVQLLLESGASVNAVSNRSESPLHLACWAGHHPCALLLLENGALVNAVEQKVTGVFAVAKIVLFSSFSVSSVTTLFIRLLVEVTSPRLKRCYLSMLPLT